MRMTLSRRVLGSLALLVCAGVFHTLWAASLINIFVVDQTLVSSQRYSRDLSDFTYRIRITNQGAPLVGASAFVRSTSPNTVILDNEVFLGNVPAGTTLTSSDTFTLRQNRLVPFNPANLIWTFEGQPANTRPIANAGVDQTVRTGTVVTLDGTASSDADGNSLRYIWTLTSRPAGSSATLSGAATGRPTFVVDRGGTYVFSLIVNDGTVDSVADEVRISTTNSTPIANAGADRTVARGAQVTLDGSASSDPDFDALGFNWSIVAAPTGSTAGLSNNSVMSPTITLDRPGSYTFRLTVTDGALTSSPDTVVISTENSVPVANAGPDQAVTRGTQVTLDGSASSDADNEPLSLFWTWASRPIGSTAVLDTTNSLRPSFAADVAGLYVAQLIVNDGLADSAPDTVSVTASVPANNRPIANNDSASTDAGVPVTINVLGNDSDPDAGTTLAIASFTQPPTGGSVVQVASALRFTPSAGFSGVATFQYTISDGDLTATAFVSVTVNGPSNLAPVVNAGADKSATLPGSGAATVTLDGSVNDDGKPLPANLSISWSTISGPGSVSFSAPNAAVSNASFTVAGTYVLRLTASDGALSSSDEVQVVVAPPANTPPTLRPISDRNIKVGAKLSLQLLANDPDAQDTLTYAMTNAPGGATFSAPSGISWTPGGNQVGSFSFTATVRDAAGASDSKSFTVTVTDDNRPPVFGALPDDRTVTRARYVKAIAVSDPDADAVTLSLLEGPSGLALNGSAVTWQPTLAQTGTFSVKLRAIDARGAITAAMYRITVDAGTPPVARDDSYKVKVGETLTVAAPGVLANDASPGGGALSANKLSDPALGSLTAFDANGSFSYTAPATDPRPPFAVIATKIGNGAIYSPPPVGIAPALADLNQDGKPDLIYFGYSGPIEVATAISGANNQPLWSSIGGYDANNCANSLGNYPGYALGDIADSGQIELVTVTSCNNGETSQQRIAAFRPDGSRKWVSPKLTKDFFDVHCFPGGCVPGTPATLSDFSLLFDTALSVARLAPNEAPVILARVEVPATAGQVLTDVGGGNLDYKNYGCRLVTGDIADMGQACNATLILSGTDGHVLQVLRSPQRPQFNRGIPISPFNNNPPFAADLDGDGVVELVSGADVWKRVGNTWTLAWAGAAEPEQVLAADLDGDGRQEIIWALDRNQQLLAGTPYLGFVGIVIFDASGQELRRIPLPSSFPGMMTVADVDGDHVPEFLITEGGRLHVMGTDGAYKWTYLVPDNPVYPQPVSYRTSYRNNVVVYDLDGDGNAEVIFSSASGLHILEGRTGASKALINMGPRYANIQASNTTFVTDWDNDGHADIISFGEIGGSANEAFAYVVRAANNDWLPATRIHNQAVFQPTGVNEAGRILYDASIPRSYRNPLQQGVVRDPRETAGTVFQYAANDGIADSNPAKVFLEIKPANSPPVFTSRAPTVMQASGPSPYIYQAIAVDPDAGDTLTYSIDVSATNGITGAPYVVIDSATGAISMLRSASFGAFSLRITVTATDSQGAAATQTFVIRHETAAPVAVPNVVGSSLSSATIALNAGSLQSAVLQEQFSAQPTGTVIAQNPLAASTQPVGTLVLLTVSKGPAPTIVPNVVGRQQASATTALTVAGFTASVSRQFSNVDEGIVIAQAVPAGTEQAGGSVAIVVSAGTGLDLVLSRSATPSNESIPFTVVSRDVGGAVLPSPALTISLATDSATTGAMPTLSGSSIVSSATTRGRYRITVTDGSKTTSALFVVLQPNTAAKPTQLAYFAQLDAALGTMDSLLSEANTARLAGNTALMSSKMVAWVNAWRSVNLNRLSISTPVAPEGGFPLESSELAALGVTASPDDALNKTILADANDDLLDLEEALLDGHTQTQQIVSMFRAFNDRVDRLRNVTPGEYGVADAKGDYAVLMAHRIPRMMDALVEQVAHVFGMPARARRYPLLGNNAGGAAGHANDAFTAQRWSRPMMASLSASPGAAQVNLTLAEELTVTTVQALVEQMNVTTVRKAYKAAWLATGWSVAVMIVAHHVKEFAGGSDPNLIVTTGASFSINTFRTAYSTIEGLGLNGRHPSMNQVMIVGPALALALNTAAEKVKALGGAPSTAAGVARARDLDEINDGLKEIQDAGDAVNDGLQGVLDEVANVYQNPHERSAVSDCLFVSGPLCRSIQYRNGFVPTYKPAGLSLPVPILFLVVNTETGATLVGTPEFLPSP